MPFKGQHFFNLDSRLPLFQGSITSSKYFVINSTGNCIIRFVTQFLPVDLRALYTTVQPKLLNRSCAGRYLK